LTLGHISLFMPAPSTAIEQSYLSGYILRILLYILSTTAWFFYAKCQLLHMLSISEGNDDFSEYASCGSFCGESVSKF
jgi:hypothetical protein